jgi:hypothetical protein
VREILEDAHRRWDGTGAMLGSLCGKLHEFKAHLARHFELEEQEGLFDNLRQCLPAEEPIVAGLEGEHGRFLERLEGLLGKLERSDAAGFAYLRPDLDDFIRALLRHEAVENELLGRAYSEDQGNVD